MNTAQDNYMACISCMHRANLASSESDDGFLQFQARRKALVVARGREYSAVLRPPFEN